MSFGRARTQSTNRRPLHSGPIRYRRIVNTTINPALVLAIFWEPLGLVGRVALVLLCIVGAYRSIRMGIAVRGDYLIVRGFIHSSCVPISTIHSVQFRRGRHQASHRLHLFTVTGEGDRPLVADGVSMRRWASLSGSPGSTRDEKRATRRVDAFFESTDIAHIPPA